MPSALAVIALSPRGTMFDPGPVRLHGEARRRRGHRRPARPRPAAGRDAGRSSPSAARATSATSWSSSSTARATRSGIQAIRDAGARVRLITDGDVSASLLAVARPLAGDACCGASAARRRASSRPRRSRRSAAAFVGRLWPRDDDERQAALDAGYDLDRVLDQDELVARRRLLLLGHRRDRRRRAAGRALRGQRRRRPSRSSCARAPGRCAASARATTAPKLRAYTGERYG